MPLLPTSRQQEIVEFLKAEVQSRGMMPTQREIADRFGFASPNSVRTHLRLMAKKGMVKLVPGKARGLRLTCSDSSGIPILGCITAGHPREAHQDADQVLPVAPGFFPGTDLFALCVKGDSMKDAGILPGDIAVMNSQQDVADGEIAAVLLEEDATLKFVFRRAGAIVLRGANSSFPDIVVRRDESRTLRILGRYVGLVRKKGGVA